MRKNHSKIVCIKLVHLPYFIMFVFSIFNANLFAENHFIMEANTGFTLFFSSVSFFAVIKTLVSSAYRTGLPS